METVNHTPFPAQAFEAVDQHAQRYHVAVLRQTLSFASGKLEYADRQAPLCDTDTCFNGGDTGDVRQESDYCPYKPKCDVIVNAVAYPPKDKTVRDFFIALKVRRPDTPWPLPERPRGLNPQMSADCKTINRWLDELERAKQKRVPGESLIDKVLVVTGERAFKKRFLLTRVAQWLIKWSTLTLIRPTPWTLSSAQPCTALPLRYEFAFGGQCRIDAGDSAARKLRPKQRLTPEQLADHPDRDAAPARRPVAHAVCEQNPIGRGFAQAWHLRATRQRVIPAPRIERLSEPITARLFWHWQNPSGKAGPPEPAGLGVVSKTHPARRALLGAIDPAFARGDAVLPADFDFGIWNAAPADQQIDFLRGDEIFELINLCRPGTPGSYLNAHGSAILRLTRPEHECFVRMRLGGGETLTRPMAVDTVLIEPEDCALTLVWRAALPKEDDAPVDTCEFRMRTFSERDRLPRDIASWREWAARPEPANGEAATEAAP